MKNGSLEIGVVGLGKGRYHAQVCASLPNVYLRAVSDKDADRLASVAT